MPAKGKPTMAQAYKAAEKTTVDIPKPIKDTGKAVGKAATTVGKAVSKAAKNTGKVAAIAALTLLYPPTMEDFRHKHMDDFRHKQKTLQEQQKLINSKNLKNSFDAARAATISKIGTKSPSAATREKTAYNRYFTNLAKYEKATSNKKKGK